MKFKTRRGAFGSEHHTVGRTAGASEPVVEGAGGVLGVDEVEFGGREGQRFPVEAAFEEERATGVFGDQNLNRTWFALALNDIGRQRLMRLRDSSVFRSN